MIKTILILISILYSCSLSIAQSIDAVIIECDTIYFDKSVAESDQVSSPKEILDYFFKTDIQLSDKWFLIDTIELTAFGVEQVETGQPVFYFLPSDKTTYKGEIWFCSFKFYETGEYGQDLDSCIFTDYYLRDDFLIISERSSKRTNKKEYKYRIDWTGNYCCRLIRI